MANYTEDSDLVKKRSNILQLGVTTFDDQHTEATRIVNRDLKFWYEAEALGKGIEPASVPFDQTCLLEADEEIKPAVVLLVLSLAYDFVAKDMPKEQDGFSQQAVYYREQFEKEWEAAKVLGFTYDWDKSAGISVDEKPKVRYRTLVRG